MNKTLIAWLSGTIFAVVSAWGQGTFQNLDFEAAHNLPAPGGSAATTNLLPGWLAFSGTNQLSLIPYNDGSAVPRVGLYGLSGFEISGSFDVLLSNDGSIRQTGLVPTNAMSLLFKGSWTSLSPLGVFLGGQSLSYTAMSNGPNYTLYGADISAFAGQTASLAFLALGPIRGVDDIQFSPQAIPEPSVLALLGGGGLFLVAWCRRQRKC